MRGIRWGRTTIPFIAVVLAAIGLSTGAGTTTPAAAQSETRPNVLLIVSDDQPSEMFTPRYMPAVFQRIAGEGVQFRRAYVNSSVCCPSRAQILTGLYEHHTGVDENSVGLDRPTLPMALHDQGYRTAMIGKYLNSWNTCGPRPEYDRWACVASGRSNYSLVDPWINDDGAWSQVTGYQPDLLADRLIGFVNGTPVDQPFFALYAPTTPHLPANGGKYQGFSVPPVRDPNYDEETRTLAHPEWVRSFPLTIDEASRIDSQHRQMGRGTRALDDSVARILTALGPRLDQTLVIFISDNGYHYGDHRRIWKASPFEGSVKVPFAIRYPIARPTTQPLITDALAQNVDIAPTIAEAAGIPWAVDGRSLMPILDGSAAAVRDAALVQRCRGLKFLTDPCRGLGWYPDRQTTNPSYEAIITADLKLIRYPTSGERQLFDLGSDPYEMTNLAGAPALAAAQADLESRLDQLLAPPPVDTTIVTGPSRTFARRSATFTFFSATRTATTTCRLVHDGVPGDPFDCSGQRAVIGGLDDGAYVFEVWATDLTGATDPTPATRSFTVTSSGPRVEISPLPPAQRARSVTATFSSDVPDISFECRIAPLGDTTTPFAPCDPANGVGASDLPDGRWAVEVRATDPATGLVTTPPAQAVVRIDNVGPGWVFDARPPTATASTTATFAMAPTEGVDGAVTCRLDAKPAFDCSSGSFTLPSVAQGNRALTVTAKDLVGNVSATRVTWFVDLTPPSVSISQAPPSVDTNTSPTFRFSTVGGGSRFLCTLDAWAPTPCKAVQPLGTLGLGQHTLEVRATDKVGNLSPPATYRWTIVTP